LGWSQFLGDKLKLDNSGKIDWIFMRGEFETIDSKIIMDSVDGRYPSDHYFISSIVEIKEKL